MKNGGKESHKLFSLKEQILSFLLSQGKIQSFSQHLRDKKLGGKIPMKALMVLDLKREKWLHEISVNFETRWLMSEASSTPVWNGLMHHKSELLCFGPKGFLETSQHAYFQVLTPCY